MRDREEEDVKRGMKEVEELKMFKRKMLVVPSKVHHLICQMPNTNASYNSKKNQQQPSYRPFGVINKGITINGYPIVPRPPTQDGWWPNFMDQFASMMSQCNLSYQVSMSVHRANIANEVHNYTGPKEEDINVFDMRNVQKETGEA